MDVKLHLLHIVRRYGPVGGMERYVWELTLHLHKLGHDVTVLCERCHVDKPHGIAVYELGEVAPRPRWLAAMRFDRHVRFWLETNPQKNTIIHSHERVSVHDLTTFHGSLFATVLEKPWWKLISPRIAMQLHLERRELAVAQCIVPNSQRIKQQLAEYYPEYAHKLSRPVIPGVAVEEVRAPREVARDGGVVGFVGTEWKRKGLAQAIQAVARLRASRPNLTFMVIGPKVEEVQHLFADWQGGYELHPWEEHVDFSRLDVLLHPARSEPYGMNIIEAMAAGVPVVVSDACGAAPDILPEAGKILPTDACAEEWAAALDEQLSRSEPVPQFERGWSEVAREYALILRTRCMLTAPETAEARMPGIDADTFENEQGISGWHPG